MPALGTGEELHPLSVDDYHRMIEAGILGPEDRVELLDGALVAVSPEGPAHAAVSSRMNRLLVLALADRLDLAVRTAAPLTLGRRSEPEPDFAVVRADAFDTTRHPGASLLVVELSRTSLRKDRGRKARLYAEAEIPEYWVVDLLGGQVHVHRRPGPRGYAEEAAHAPPQVLTCTALPEVVVDLAALLEPGAPAPRPAA